MSRRILIFSIAYYPKFVGGAEVAVKEITDRISPQEIIFDMITLNSGGEKSFETIGNVNVYRIFNKNGPVQKMLFTKFAFLKAVRLHRRNRYDATWSIMANYAGFAALFFKMFYPRISFVLTLQEGDPFSYIRKRVGILYPLFKRIFTRASHIQAISKYLADWARNMGAKCPITVVANGVDYDNFSKIISPESRETLRNQLGFSRDDIVLVTASRLVLKNAVDNIISSLTYLPKNCKLLIMGIGDDEAKLKEQVNQLKLNDRVVFKGFVPHKELPAYLQSSEIFIRPSRSEGLGNSFLEAMATNIPVIATPVGGIFDFLVNGETGLFCEVENPKSIAQKVEKLIKDKDSREYIIDRAHKMVKENYRWEGIAEKMKNILNSKYEKGN